MGNYTASEMMIVAAARELADARVVFVGIGLPNIACNLAQRIVAPHLELIYESGVYGARPSRLPLSIGDPCLVSGAVGVMPMPQLLQYYLQRGLVDVGFLGAAQIDRYGNLNTTVIGEYQRPKVRLPGSGGACEIALMCRRVLIITRLSRRTFVEKLDFVTSPGFLQGGDARARLGRYGEGPAAVVTDMGIFRFDHVTHEMFLASLYPGCTVESVQEQVSWPLRVAAALDVVAPPSAEELCILRQELDPIGRLRV
ncbi:MAG: CoA-transferase subunit beta [Anaerolineae bacterium]|nr:CoA-transferase subunit beta [Anaerolineae bacterium]MDW8071978.1 CoA-transferase [Anaerolineae bacterium]